MAVRDVIRRWYANGLAFSFDFIADLSNHMVLQSGMPRLGRESYFFGGHSGCVIVSIQFDRSRIHLNEFCFNPVSAAYIIHFVDQLEPPRLLTHPTAPTYSLCFGLPPVLQLSYKGRLRLLGRLHFSITCRLTFALVLKPLLLFDLAKPPPRQSLPVA